MRCTDKTLVHYHYTVGGFVNWLGERGVSGVEQITATDTRAYLITLHERSLKDTTQHAHTRGIEMPLNWLVQEGDLSHHPLGQDLQRKARGAALWVLLLVGGEEASPRV